MEKTTKKVTSKSGNKNTSSKKKNSTTTNVKNEEKELDTKEIRNKEDKKKSKGEETSQFKKIINKPVPIIIALCILCVVQLFFLININAKNAIYTGDLNKDNLQIGNIHMFINNDMNYFYAAPALYLGEDVDVYNFEMGYYVELDDGEYLSFATRSRELDNPSNLREIVDEMSAWNFFETSLQDYFFSQEVIDNIDNLHFMIKASSIKNTNEADITIDYPIELHKITK